MIAGWHSKSDLSPITPYMTSESYTFEPAPVPELKTRDRYGVASIILSILALSLVIMTPVFYMLLIVFLGQSEGWGVGTSYQLMFTDFGFWSRALLTGFGYSGILLLSAAITALVGLFHPSKSRRLSRIMLRVTSLLFALSSVAFILTLP